MKHLDERVSDLVDNRLDHDKRDRALAHLTTCERCRYEVEYERAAKGALGGMSPVEPSQRLVSTLLALAEPEGPLPPERPGFPVAAAPVAGWRDHETARSAWKTPRLGLPGRGVRFAAVGALSVGGMLALLTAVGAPDEPASSPEDDAVSVVPPMDEYTVEHVRSTGILPFAEPASYLMPSQDSGDDDW